MARKGALLRTRWYVGVVTDTMCKTSHKGMGATDERKCVLDCVGDGKTYRFALLVGKDVHVEASRRRSS